VLKKIIAKNNIKVLIFVNELKKLGFSPLLGVLNNANNVSHLRGK